MLTGSTGAAAKYLTRNRAALRREFRDGPFALRLGFRDVGSGYDYHPPRRLLTLRAERSHAEAGVCSAS